MIKNSPTKKKLKLNIKKKIKLLTPGQKEEKTTVRQYDNFYNLVKKRITSI